MDSDRQELDAEIARLQEEVTFYQSILDGMQNLVFVKSYDSTSGKAPVFRYVNNPLAQLLNSTKEQIFGKSDEDFIYDSDVVKAFVEADKKVMSGENDALIPRETLTTPSGQSLEVSTRVVTMKMESTGDLMVLGVSTEIPESILSELISSSLSHVEVFVTAELSENEISALHIHLAELKASAVATGVFLSGYGKHISGSILTFTAEDKEEILSALPDLLAPFLLSRAVDWPRTFGQLPEELQKKALLLSTKTNAAARWRLAKVMADVFEGFRNAKVCRISDGRSKGISIMVYTSKKIAEQLQQQPTLKVDQSTTLIMRDNYSSSGQAIQGPDAHVHDVTFSQHWKNLSSSVDLDVLARELKILSKSAFAEAEETDERIAAGHLASAERSAADGDGPKTLEYLRLAGKWALQISEKVGIPVATAVIKETLGVK
ncbi:MAG: PAS domain-containing protein [Verrucomicrobiae bacterium]|nr:PAS domain-containing protein [Verrucomicrobiae bacterium]